MHMREKNLSCLKMCLDLERIYFYSRPCGLVNNYNVNAKCLLLLYIGNILTRNKSAPWKTQLVLALARTLFYILFFNVSFSLWELSLSSSLAL